MSKFIAIFAHCLVLAAGFLAFFMFVFRVGPNNCEMTYMFEMPKYIKVKLDTKELYPKYNFYYYTEGDRGLSYSGVPALFIPGNAGSYRQVRSVGSVALRMAEGLNVKKFDFFALDFDEELSAFSGSLLKKQTAFTSLCVKRILDLYKGRHTTLAVVGHSMGGVIARALFSLSDFDHSSVSVVMTQAAPHERPVLLLDEDLRDYYSSTNEAWRRMSDRIYANLSEGVDARRVTLVSTGGGDRDLLVRTDLTGLSWIGSHHHAIWTSTSSVPKAWVSTDHLCHVWCKQMVMTTVRALYDIIDPVTHQISTNCSHRYEVMKYHFLTNHGDSFYAPPSGRAKVNRGFGWSVVEVPWRHRGKAPRSRNVVVDLTGIREGYQMVIMSDTTNSNWIGACTPSPGAESCDYLDSLTSAASLLPKSRSSHYKVVHLNYEQLRLHQYIVLVLPASSYSMAMVDVFLPEERTTAVQSSSPSASLSSSSPSSSSSLWFWQTHESFLTGSSFHSLTFKDFDLLDSYDVRVKTFGCQEGDEAPSVMVFEDERREYPTYALIRTDQDSSMELKLVTRGTSLPKKVKDRIPGFPRPRVKLYLSSNCTFRVEVRPSVLGIFGQVARFHLPFLPSFIAMAVVSRLGEQFAWKASYLTHFIPLVSFLVLKMSSDFVGLDQLLGCKRDDSIRDRNDRWPILLLTFLFSRSLLKLLETATDFACVVLRCWFGPPDTFSFLIHVTMLISFWTCSSVALLAAQVLCLTTIARCKASDGNESPKPLLISFFLVILLVFLLDFPSFIIWVKDVHIFQLLGYEKLMIQGGLYVIVLRWQRRSKVFSKSRHDSTLCWLLFLVVAPLVVLYGSVSLYRLRYFLFAALALPTFHDLAMEVAERFGKGGGEEALDDKEDRDGVLELCDEDDDGLPEILGDEGDGIGVAPGEGIRPRKRD